MTLYLDYSASTPVNEEVLEYMVEVYKNYYGNAGSRTHVYGQRANEIVQKSRSSIASLLNIDKSEVYFTSGATESNNLAILGLARWGEQNNRKHIVSSAIEHKAVLEPLEYLKSIGFTVDLVGVDSSGRLKVDDVLSLVRQDTLLVSIMHANNETGIIQPVDEIGTELTDTGTYFHVDAAQTYGKLVEEMKSLKYDFLSISGHKIFAPQGIGALIVKSRNYNKPPILPITFGGGQENGLRPGTLPVALIAGLGKATDIAANKYFTWAKVNQLIKDSILKQISDLDYSINGDPKYGLPHVLNISFNGVDAEALMLALRDFHAISNGSACTSQDYQNSHVLIAMGLQNELIDSSVRLSWGKIPELDLTAFVKTIKELK